ncbi:MAG: homoserine kinase [Deltaproteobacteria bacterium]|nr:homoserine kinase [Deltaproteobacteria bacterium]
MNAARVRVFAPASIGNVIAGFDVMGAAVAALDGAPLGDTVTVEPAAETQLVVEGPFAARVPAAAAENLCWRATLAVASGRGIPLPALRMTLCKAMPVGSGLGSSSASAVAGAVATAAWFDAVDVRELPSFLEWRAARAGELLDAAGKAEAHAAGATHLDNVAPCLLGGWQLLTPAGPRSLPVPPGLRWVLACPDFELATRTARAVLPAQLDRATAVAHSANLAAAVHALHSGEWLLLKAALRDVVAEPHRAALVPGFREVQSAARGAGALACSLSGAGPAVVALVEPASVQAVCAAMCRGFAEAGVSSSVRVCAVDPIGARPGAADVVDQ